MALGDHADALPKPLKFCARGEFPYRARDERAAGLAQIVPNRTPERRFFFHLKPRRTAQNILRL